MQKTTKKIDLVNVHGLTIKEYGKFLELYTSKKEIMSTEDIVTLWNRFITKPSQCVVFGNKK